MFADIVVWTHLTKLTGTSKAELRLIGRVELPDRICKDLFRHNKNDMNFMFSG